jgi:hypothetical protein
MPRPAPPDGRPTTQPPAVASPRDNPSKGHQRNHRKDERSSNELPCGPNRGRDSSLCVAKRTDPFRPEWKIHSPSGQQLTVEFDRLRSLWRITPGEYVRRNLEAALAQAAGDHHSEDWTAHLSHDFNAELHTTSLGGTAHNGQAPRAARPRRLPPT